MITAIIFVVVLALLILTHEFGHFIVAKKSGIRVDEFGFGFPPKLFGIKIGETEYSLNLIPIGGFCKIYGENPDEESISGPDSGRSMLNKSKWIQTAVLVAGVLMNIALAWFLVSVNLSLGMPMDVDSVPAGVKVENPHLLVASVLKNSPAATAGLTTGDSLIQLRASDGVLNNPSAETVRNFVSSRAGETINVAYERDGKETVLQVVPKTGVTSSGAAIGITMAKVGTVKLPVLQAFWTGIGLTYNLVVATAEGFKYFFSNLLTQGQSALADVAGPIGLFNLVGDASRLGFVYLLNFIALISINLAILNLLPVPALDGGRLLFLLIEAIKGSRISPKIANTLNITGFVLLMALMLVVALSDISRLI